MKIAVRVVIGLLGLLGAFAAVLFWFSTENAAHGVGLVAADARGLAAIRADIAGFFGAQALFALLAAWKGRAEYALPPIVLMGFAFTGRVISLLLGGFDPAIISGMVVEAATIAVFLFAWRTLKTQAT